MTVAPTNKVGSICFQSFYKLYERVRKLTCQTQEKQISPLGEDDEIHGRAAASRVLQCYRQQEVYHP